MYEGYETMLIARSGRILTVTLNRPEVRNATNEQMHRELVRVFGQIAADPQTNVVVLTGAGEKAFSAGGDMDTLVHSRTHPDAWAQSMTEAKDILYGLVSLDKPVIARINGDAIGLGCTLALFCDITIAAEGARIADPHVKVGLVAGDGGAIIWPLLVGNAKAKYYLLTGDLIGASEAAAIGLISEAVPRDQLDQRVQAVAESLAAGASLAIGWTKRAFNMQLKQQLETLLEGHLGLETLSHLTDDHGEAIEAFKAKRAPVFKGR